MFQGIEMLWIWKTPWDQVETSWKAALFHNLEIDFSCKSPWTYEHQVWNSTEMCQSVGVKAAWRGYLKNIWHTSNIYK